MLQRFLLLGLFVLIGSSTSALASVVSLEADGTSLYLSAEKELESIIISGESYPLSWQSGRAAWPVAPDDSALHLIHYGDHKTLVRYSIKRDDTIRTSTIPLWKSLLPPLIAIGLALLLKEVVFSLFMGVWSGAMIMTGVSLREPGTFVSSFFDVIGDYIIRSLNDSGHLSVIVFSLLIGGMVAIISKNGGMAGVVLRLSKYARSAKSTQFITWLLGISIFFDDYANTLIVGNTMRAVTDKYRISREKLAYIVDSTAAPVASIAFVTTWIGAELTYIKDGVSSIDADIGMTTYAIFINSLRFSFYPILALIFILLLIWMRRDYGPMHRAELRSRTKGQVKSDQQVQDDEGDMEDLSPVAGAPLRARYAVFPVLTVVLVTILGLIFTGFQNSGPATMSISEIWVGLDTGGSFLKKLGTLIGNSDSYQALLWSSLSGLIVAAIMSIAGKIMSLKDVVHHMTTGFKTMLPAIIILTLAWTLAITTEELHTADYLAALASQALHPIALPAVIFVLAAFISFSTGSSWSTMAILYPIAIPASWAICEAAGYDAAASMPILLHVISTVLAASVLGDHCSPISDTTILSSLASDCNHLDHVKTQLPYALTVGLVSIILGTLATALGGSWLVCILLIFSGVGALYLIVRYVGKEVPE